MTLTETILSQSPEGTTCERVNELIVQYNSNTVDILTELWALGEKASDKKREGHDKWNDIRGICDSFEKEMEVFMKSKTT